jgi:hypothetical protein
MPEIRLSGSTRGGVGRTASVALSPSSTVQVRLDSELRRADLLSPPFFPLDGAFARDAIITLSPIFRRFDCRWKTNY